MFKSILGIIIALGISTSAFAENSLDFSSIEKNIINKFIKEEWKCPNGNTPPFDVSKGEYVLISSFSNPFKHYNHLFIGHKPTHFVIELEQHFDKDNVEVLTQCVLGYGFYEQHTQVRETPLVVPDSPNTETKENLPDNKEEHL